MTVNIMPLDAASSLPLQDILDGCMTFSIPIAVVSVVVIFCCDVYHNAECPFILSVIMLSFIKLSVIMLRFLKLSVIMLSFLKLSDTFL